MRNARLGECSTARLYAQEAHGLALLLPLVELIWVDVFDDLEMPLRWAHVSEEYAWVDVEVRLGIASVVGFMWIVKGRAYALSEGNHVNPHIQSIAHRRANLVVLLAQSEHE